MAIRNTKDSAIYYTTAKLGPKRELTPEGFLLCKDVPVARTGEMVYAAGEVPIEPSRDGLIRVSREAADIFSEITIASCLGKPVTLDHPDEFVDPVNYGQLGKGVMLNVRRGSGIEDDLLFADLLVTDRAAIAAINDGIEEVSLGYEADYEQVSPGRGVQRNIIVNHVALVARGRCGPRCAIGDQDTMPTKKKPSWMDKIRASFKSKDEAALEEALQEGQKAMDEESEESEEEKEQREKEAKTADALSRLTTTLDALAKDVAALKKGKGKDSEPGSEKPGEEEEEGKETNDEGDLTVPGKSGKANVGTTYTGDSAEFADVVARCEILSPGFKMPTRDSIKTIDALCACKRQALQAAMATSPAAVTPFLVGQDLSKLTNDQLHSAFIGASELKKVMNNSQMTPNTAKTKDFGKPTTAASINAQNRDFWANRK